MKKLQFIVIQLIALSLSFVTVAFANTVSLDLSFNESGYKIWSPVELPLRANAGLMVVLPDGKKLIGGNVENNSNNSYVGFLLMRLNADGTVDTSFGTNGATITTVDRFAEVGALLIQTDGKILLGGTSAAETSSYNFTVLRFNADGSLDTSFNGVGYVTKSVNATSYDLCTGMALQPDGKIVLVGNTAAIPWVGPTLDHDVALMRFNTDGSLDTTFNGTGILVIGNDQDKNEYGRKVIVDSSGKIIVAANHLGNIPRQHYRVMRLNPDGSFDTGFGVGGSVSIVPNNSTSNNLFAMARQSNGKIIVAGDGGTVRITPDGVLDTTFGINGIAAAPNPVYSLTVTDDDKILITSSTSIGRLLENGAFDTKFLYQFRILPGNTSCRPYTTYVNSDNTILIGANCDTGSYTTNKPALFQVKETRTKRFLSFSGAERTDYSLFRPSVNGWITSFSGNPSPIQFGISTDRPAPADFTGDGRADIAVFRPSTGEWLIMRSDNGTVLTQQFGLSEDIPVPADYDGDQIDDIAVYRPSNGTWYILKSTGGVTYETFGLSTDKVVPSDYDGDFKTDIAIYRPSSGQWWIKRSSDNLIYAFEFGTAEDKPMQGDYTGDGKSDAAFWRPSTGQWFILRSEDSSYYGFPFGLSDDLPAPGDYGGSTRFDYALYRPSTNRWYILTAEGTLIQRDFGSPGDKPVSNFFVP